MRFVDRYAAVEELTADQWLSQASFLQPDRGRSDVSRKTTDRALGWQSQVRVGYQ